MNTRPVAAAVVIACALALPQPAAAAANPALQGGPVMTSPQVHLIFWLPDGYHLRTDGTSQTDAEDMVVVRQFVRDLASTAYFNIANQYCASNGCPQTISLASSTVYTQAYPHIPLARDNSDVSNAVLASLPPTEGSGGLSDLYVVFLAAGIIQDGFGTAGYHSYFYPSGETPVIFALIVSSGTIAPVPNGPIDSYITLLSHEIMEAVTDPLATGWWDATVPIQDGEIGDKCNILRGTEDTDGADLVAPNGDRYQVQKQWSNGASDPKIAGSGSCQMSNPAISLVSPDNGPNGGGTTVALLGGIFDPDVGPFGNGGTQVSFGGVPATSVFCAAPNLCFATSPAAYPSGPVNGSPPNANAGPNRVPVNVTVGGFTSATEDQPNASSSNVGGDPTYFSYAAGPDCGGKTTCPAVLLKQPPNLTISCRNLAYFWDQNGIFVGVGPKYTELTGNPGDGIYACTCETPGRLHFLCRFFGCCAPGPGSSCTFFNATVPEEQWCTAPQPPPIDGAAGGVTAP